MRTWIHESGAVVRTKTIKEFAELVGWSHSMAKTLACGLRSRLNGWCSTSPRSKRHREHFMTVLVNIDTGERKMIGQSQHHFARRHELCPNSVWKLVNGYFLAYKGWVLEKTLQAANEDLSAPCALRDESWTEKCRQFAQNEKGWLSKVGGGASLAGCI